MSVPERVADSRAPRLFAPGATGVATDGSQWSHTARERRFLLPIGRVSWYSLAPGVRYERLPSNSCLSCLMVGWVRGAPLHSAPGQVGGRLFPWEPTQRYDLGRVPSRSRSPGSSSKEYSRVLCPVPAVHGLPEALLMPTTFSHRAASTLFGGAARARGLGGGGLALSLCLSVACGEDTPSERTPADLDFEFRVRAATVTVHASFERVVTGTAEGETPLRAAGTTDSFTSVRGWGVVIDAERALVVANNHAAAMSEGVELRDLDGRSLGTAELVGSSECHDIAVLQLRGESGVESSVLEAELDWFVDLVHPDLPLLAPPATSLEHPSPTGSASSGGFSAVDWYEGRARVASGPGVAQSSFASVDQGFVATFDPRSAGMDTASTQTVLPSARMSGPIFSALNPAIVGLAYATTAVAGVGPGAVAVDGRRFAVAASEASLVVHSIIAGQAQGTLGITPRTWLVADVGAPSPRGVWVESVRPGSVANAVGLRPGDLLTSIGNWDLADGTDPANFSLDGYCRALTDFDGDGDQLDIEILRFAGAQPSAELELSTDATDDASHSEGFAVAHPVRCRGVINGETLSRSGRRDSDCPSR